MKRRGRSTDRRRFRRLFARIMWSARWKANTGEFIRASASKAVVRRLIAFRDRPPYGGGSGMPCGACREFFLQLSEKNRNMEILVDFETRETVRLESLVPNWWGWERYEQAKKA